METNSQNVPDLSHIPGMINQMNVPIKSKHSYTLSLSKCISMIQEEFDAETTAKNCSEKGFDDPDSKYFHMTADDILAQWQAKNDQSRMFGKQLDAYAELILTGREAKDLELWKIDNNYEYNTKLKNLCDGFDQFMDVIRTKTDYMYVARELQIFTHNQDDEYVNGRFDCLFYSPGMGKYILLDWKTNEDISGKNRFQKLKGPCYNYDDSKGNTYSLQLAMYKKALAETYGITDADHIDTFILQFLQTPTDKGFLFLLHKPYIPYDSQLIDNLISFSYKKYKTLKA